MRIKLIKPIKTWTLAISTIVDHSQARIFHNASGILKFPFLSLFLSIALKWFPETYKNANWNSSTDIQFTMWSLPLNRTEHGGLEQLLIMQLHLQMSGASRKILKTTHYNLFTCKLYGMKEENWFLQGRWIYFNFINYNLDLSSQCIYNKMTSWVNKSM